MLNTSLPIEAIKNEFIRALTTHTTIILSAPPGAGKSTCLPLWLLSLENLVNQKIYLLQPRRLAVKNIATYLANQLNEKVGETVGYRLRNENRTSKNTRLEVITEGILTQIIQNDAELVNCALVIFDEFHERSLHGDLAFALTREVQQNLREDLKILLMSATLDSDYLINILPDSVSIKSKGRSFPVNIEYQAPANIKQWRNHALNIIKMKMNTHQGSILVFLPGVADIRFLDTCLCEQVPDDLILCPLFGDLTLKQQQQAISPSLNGQRKLVLATNIAETSLTIEGITLVIDCGFEKVAIYDSASLMNKLEQKQIAKASAIQRAGRAGRLMAGQCIRLYAKDDFQRRPEFSINEIQQADLLPTLIEAARWGVSQLGELPMLELPNKAKEQQAWQELQSLAIVNEQHKLTKHGKQVAQLSCHPRFAHMINAALSFKQLNYNGHNEALASLACLLAALLEEKDIFRAEQSRFNCNVTHRIQTLLQKNSRTSTTTVRIIQQAKVLAKKINCPFITQLLPLADIGLLLAFAYPERIAKNRTMSGEFLCANGKGVCLNIQDALVGENYLVIADLMQSKGVLQVRLAAPLSLVQLEAVFLNKIITKQVVKYDESKGKIIARQQTLLDAIVLKESVINNMLDSDRVAQLWCDLVTKKGLNFISWPDKATALTSRWQWLNKFCPQFDLPDISGEKLLSKVDEWLKPFVGKILNKSQLNKLDLSAQLLSLLSYQQQQILKQVAPTHYIGPTGRYCPISYNDEKSPKVSLPMQEVYGLTQTPSVAIVRNNKGIPLILELLSPAQRPIQVTQDLIQFWAGSYKAVQKEMKSKYPKHYWPDDPLNAKPTNKVKRHLAIDPKI